MVPSDVARLCQPRGCLLRLQAAQSPWPLSVVVGPPWLWGGEVVEVSDGGVAPGGAAGLISGEEKLLGGDGEKALPGVHGGDLGAGGVGVEGADPGARGGGG